MKKEILKEKGAVSGKYRFITRKAGTDEVIRTSCWIDNLVMESANHGTNLILQAMIGLTTYPIEIDSAAIGTGNTAPADGDTNLVTPITTGIPRATQVISPVNVLTILFFIPDGDLPNGTYKEFGLFMGTQLFARSLISPTYTKSTAEDTTVEYVITITN